MHNLRQRAHERHFDGGGSVYTSKGPVTRSMPAGPIKNDFPSGPPIHPVWRRCSSVECDRMYDRAHLGPRMKLIVRRLEPGLEDVSVDLRGRQVGVPEQGLDHPKIGSPLEQMEIGRAHV